MSSNSKEIVINFRTIGDHSVLGAIAEIGLHGPDSLKDKDVTIKAVECWRVTFVKNMEDLMSFNPRSVNIEIKSFI